MIAMIEKAVEQALECITLTDANKSWTFHACTNTMTLY